MNESQMPNAKCKKPKAKCYLMYYSMSIHFWNSQNYNNRKWISVYRQLVFGGHWLPSAMREFKVLSKYSGYFGSSLTMYLSTFMELYALKEWILLCGNLTSI